ncbi:MAG: sensor histidine kinase [Thioalkalivibrionaceae bacterium]
MKRFRDRLWLAFLVLAALAVAQGIVAAWSFERALAKVEAGRIAADWYSGLLALAEGQQRLERAIEGLNRVQGPYEAEEHRGQKAAENPYVSESWLREAAVRTAIENVHDRLTKLRRLHAEPQTAKDLDNLEEASIETRDRLLSRMAQVERWLQGWPTIERPEQPAADWATDDIGSLVLTENAARWLAEAAQSERMLLVHQRAEADRLLERVRWVSGFALAAFVLASIAFAVWFSQGLRRPFEVVTQAVERYREGDFAFRLAVDLPAEFAPLAQQMNAMAADLEARGHRQTEDRAALMEALAERNHALATALDGLQATERRRRQFLADLSHELRSPATSIRGEAEIALRQPQRPERDYRMALERIVADSERLAFVVSDLLTMARAESIEWPQAMSDIDVTNPLDAALTAVRSLADSLGIELQVGQAQGALVHADARRLEQVFVIVLNNAIEYSQRGGKVVVGASIDGRHWCAEIRDEGIGLEADEINRVFDRHFRGRRARVHRPDGEGLGLAIAQMLMRMHGGWVTLEPCVKPHIGTVARICLPTVVPTKGPDS